MLKTTGGVLLPPTGCVSRTIQTDVNNLVVTHNHTNEDIDVELRITLDDDVVIEDDFSLDHSSTYNSGTIEQPGEYEYVVKTEDQTHSETITLPIKGYKLRTETRLSETRIRINPTHIRIGQVVED